MFMIMLHTICVIWKMLSIPRAVVHIVQAYGEEVVENGLEARG